MKKILFPLLTIFVMSACDDDCDHKIKIPETGDFNYEYASSGTGCWYEETENEEFRATINGKFYDKYCNLLRAGETEGSYEISNRGTRMTQSYKFMGQNQFNDWKVSNVKELSFTIASDEVAAHTYEKIVESYTLTAGQTQQINFANDYPAYYVSSYSSTNNHIASVNSAGFITAGNEKGTAYIKISHDQGNAWVKVIIGEDYADLWYDYSVLLDNSYTQMRSLLGNPDETDTENQCYKYKTEMHEIIEYVNVYINERSHTVDQVEMHFRKNVPGEVITSHLNARYYYLGDGGDTKFYHTSSDIFDSRAIFAFNSSINGIVIMPAEGFLDLWKDFTSLFGQTSDAIKDEMAYMEYPFLMSEISYSIDGSDYYSIPENDYANMIGFVFNKDKKMCEYWVYLNTDKDASIVYGFLEDKYGNNSPNKQENETSSAGEYVFYNKDNTVRITLSLEGYVKYECLTMEGPTKPTGLWPDYPADLGKTHDEIVNKYGSPVIDDDSGIWYVTANDYVQYLMFRLDAATEKTKYITLVLKDGTEPKKIVEYLGSLYTVFERGTVADGSQYAWTDGPTMAESKVGIIYRPSSNQVVYQSLVSSASVRQKISDMQNLPHIKTIPESIHHSLWNMHGRTMTFNVNASQWNRFEMIK